MAERATLDAVLLDAGGTLVRLDFEWMAECVTSLGSPLDATRLRRAEVEGRRRYDESVRALRPSKGDGPEPLGRTGDIRAYFAGMLVASGVPASLVAQALERFLAREKQSGLWTRPMEGAREALDGLADRGLRCAVVSNSDGRAEWHLERSDVRRGLEFVVDSHRVGLEKPDPRILEIALDRLGVAPDRAVFVGDIRSVDERVARAAGVHFVLIDPYSDYAEGSPAIAGIAELPEWLSARFDLPQPEGTRPEERRPWTPC